MTRVNVGIRPEELPDKLLLAEHREIKRIPNQILSGKYHLRGIPDYFTLGTGHVKFFYNKLAYILKRYQSIYDECIKRGFNVTYYATNWADLPAELCQDYVEQDRDRALLLMRFKHKGHKLLKK